MLSFISIVRSEASSNENNLQIGRAGGEEPACQPDKSSRTEVFKLQPAGHLQLNKPLLDARERIVSKGGTAFVGY